MKEKKSYRIEIFPAIVLSLIAFSCDLLALIPFVGDIVGPTFWLGAGFYLWKKGVGLFDGKKIAVWGTSLLLKLIPFLQELPVELLLGVITMVIIVRAEDKIGLSSKTLTKPMTAPRNTIKPVNSQRGIRLPRNKQVAEDVQA